MDVNVYTIFVPLLILSLVVFIILMVLGSMGLLKTTDVYILPRRDIIVVPKVNWTLQPMSVFAKLVRMIGQPTKLNPLSGGSAEWDTKALSNSNSLNIRCLKHVRIEDTKKYEHKIPYKHYDYMWTTIPMSILGFTPHSIAKLNTKKLHYDTLLLTDFPGHVEYNSRKQELTVMSANINEAIALFLLIREYSTGEVTMAQTNQMWGMYVNKAHKPHTYLTMLRSLCPSPPNTRPDKKNKKLRKRPMIYLPWIGILWICQGCFINMVNRRFCVPQILGNICSSHTCRLEYWIRMSSIHF